MNTATLKLHCNDHTGIVYHVSQFIFERGGNIIDAEQHREEIGDRFFMRIYFDIDGILIGQDQFSDELREFALSRQMEYDLSFSSIRKKMAIFVSKYDHCLYDLFLRHEYGELNVDISFILSNHEDLRSVAENFNTPFYCVPVDSKNKKLAEDQALKYLTDNNVDLIVLARYMQILSPKILDEFPHKIINIHHGFLPAFKGAKPYHQAYAKGVKLIGATSHYATSELDMGPIIEQETVKVDHTHSVDSMLALGRDIEKRVLANAVKKHLDNCITVYEQRTIVFR